MPRTRAIAVEASADASVRLGREPGPGRPQHVPEHAGAESLREQPSQRKEAQRSGAKGKTEEDRALACRAAEPAQGPVSPRRAC